MSQNTKIAIGVGTAILIGYFLFKRNAAKQSLKDGRLMDSLMDNEYKRTS